MSIRFSMRPAAVLLASATMVLTGFLIAEATAPGGNGNAGPTDAARPAVVPVLATTNTNPVPTFVPSPQEQVFHALPVCRIVDTRDAGGKLPIKTIRSYRVSGTSGFPAQGGHSGGCGVPATATAVSANFLVFDPPATSYLIAWAAGTSRPTQAVLRFNKGQTANTPATMQVTPGTNTGLSLYAGTGPVDVAVDVTGYYEPAMHLIILADGTVWYGNATHLTEVIHTAGTGDYTLVYDRSLAGCNVLTTGNGQASVLVSGSWGGSQIGVTTQLLSGGTLTTQDEGFQVFVTC